jgi:Holliday junction DNA helicase RuvA
MHVREDAHTLYGFSSKDERNLFRNLLSVSGIGPKVGMSLMSSYPIDKLTAAITQGNVDLITSAPGVGRKTAQKVIIELKEKIAKTFGLLSTDSIASFPDQDQPILKDSISALMTLGYSAAEAKSAALKVLQEDASNKNIEDIIRRSLKNLS